jgi:hypothetical protein
MLTKNSSYSSLQNSKRLIESWGTTIEFSVLSTTKAGTSLLAYALGLHTDFSLYYHYYCSQSTLDFDRIR